MTQEDWRDFLDGIKHSEKEVPPKVETVELTEVQQRELWEKLSKRKNQIT